ncbi:MULTISPECIES: copper resistance protein NlpE [Actinobacillus]|uniref:copper resistance protein NlpE n=1 Tax=Actinobacillus TaxID=713 RepID=UPI0024431FFA|nr:MULTISPECIES: copper resistance protein NlpE [Actinobacillus]WGE32757.1 copper resistance protein NlpE [Actinobacillus genomosp. 2]WGE88608.1 copper resistance protein NlpE [Actinobacillus arthritidis]
MKKLALLMAISTLGACSLLPQQSVTGTFKGDLPCADCEKIQAELILGANNSYQYNTVFIKNGKEHPFSDKGTYTWEQGKRGVIRLEKDSGALAFKVNETQAEICDANGNPPKVANNPYVLRKVK